jgi:CBS domain-containing protein
MPVPEGRVIDPLDAEVAQHPPAAPATVRQLMSPAPPSIDQFETVMAAARRMRASGAAAIPVSDECALFVGMLSDRDIVERCVADGHDPRAVTVGWLLRAQQPMIDPDRAVDAAVLAMIIRQPLAELPVVENGVLVGMVSVADAVAPLLDDETPESDLDGFWPSDLVVTPGRP